MVKTEDKLTAFFANIILAFLGGLMFMLAVGVAHHEWWPAVPTIGYWWSVVLVVLLRNCFGSVTSRRAAEDREDKELRKLRRGVSTQALVDAVLHRARSGGSS